MQEDQDPWNAPLSQPEPTHEPADQHALDFDLACVTCGYNLRGARPTGACPECGTPVETTLRPDLLHQADIGWLADLKKGSHWLVIAIVLSLLMIPVGMIIGIVSTAGSIGQGRAMPISALVPLTILGLGAFITYCVGVWFLTKPEPHRATDHTSRKIARWLILTGTIIGLPTEFINAIGTPSALLVGATFDAISSIIMLIGSLAGMLYLRTLANRIPEPSLAKQTTAVYWGNLVTMSIFILFGIGAAIYANTQGNSSATTGFEAGIGLLMCPMAIALLVFFIWSIVLMFRYRNRFAQAHHIATNRPR